MTKGYEKIVNWLKNYADNYEKGLVVGVSGGIDSAVTSRLCSLTGLKTIVVHMPIYTDPESQRLANLHLAALNQYSNVTWLDIDLKPTYNAFMRELSYRTPHADANTKSRLRMVALYQIATVENCLVVGTGNKVEDFGVGFFTKYGDGGVDISPIANLLKTEVWQLGKELGIDREIIAAKPTDGLWDDNRTDEEQLGISYQELEAAMLGEPASQRAYRIYNELHERNKHKMTPIPVWKGRL